MEEIKKQRGGRREGAGRKKGIDTTLVSVKLETRLVEALPTGTNRSKYLNEALQAKMKEDGYIE